MKILVLASGSGGHVYPALAFMRYALKEGHTVVYLGIKNSFEQRIVDEKIIYKAFLPIHQKSSYYVKHPWKIREIKRSLHRHDDWLQDIDAIFAFGGIMSLVAFFATGIYHMPLFLHEQNARLGDGNIFAGLRAKKIFSVFNKTSAPFFLQNKIVQTGNPRSLEARAYFHKNQHAKPHILFFAGSLGSETLIESLKSVTNELSAKYEVTVVTGTKYYEAFKKSSQASVHIINYAYNMLELLADMDVVVMRAGATSISEMMALEVPSILIPSPYVKHDHQRENARFLRDKQIAFMVEEKDVNADVISRYIHQITEDYALQVTMKMNMAKIQNLYAAEAMLKIMTHEI